MRRSREKQRVAALVGDLATENDAARLARSGAPVRQITTGTVCHLDAQMVERALDGWDLDALDFLFIENVGNLVCPASYDLGENLRMVLLSVTEGEDKPLKYPTIFNTADVAVITKMDLAAAVEFDMRRRMRNIDAVREGMRTFAALRQDGRGDGRVDRVSARRVARHARCRSAWSMATSHHAAARKRIRISLRGIVQGVGFRPFVYRVARRLELTGYARNSSSGLVAEAEGAAAAVDSLRARPSRPSRRRWRGFGRSKSPKSPLATTGFRHSRERRRRPASSP